MRLSLAMLVVAGGAMTAAFADPNLPPAPQHTTKGAGKKTSVDPNFPLPAPLGDLPVDIQGFDIGPDQIEPGLLWVGANANISLINPSSHAVRLLVAPASNFTPPTEFPQDPNNPVLETFFTDAFNYPNVTDPNDVAATVFGSVTVPGPYVVSWFTNQPSGNPFTMFRLTLAYPVGAPELTTTPTDVPVARFVGSSTFQNSRGGSLNVPFDFTFFQTPEPGALTLMLAAFVLGSRSAWRPRITQ